jgi:hypothetical protein
MQFNFDEYYNNLNQGDIVIAYQGIITSEWINEVLDTVEHKLDSLGVDPKVKKKIYNVLVEGLQNLYHHVDALPEGNNQFADKFGVLVVKREKDYFKISFGNFVNIDKTRSLKIRIDNINSLNQEELKEMYKSILDHKRLSIKGGGGLGLIDMARKSGNKLTYTFYEYSPDYQFYNLDIIINNN